MLYPAIESMTEKLQEAEKQYAHVHEQLQKASNQLELAEKVFGGTYIHQLIKENTQRRQTEYIPNGYYRADGIRR